MSLLLLIKRIEVQNANAVAGFTGGFPSITHFLGFVHNLDRKLQRSDFQRRVGQIDGCAVIAHEHCVHTYGKWSDNFTQNRTPPYLHKHDKKNAPPVIEEGKMNMTVSLVVGIKTDPGNETNAFCGWLHDQCLKQRLAGGTILRIGGVEIYNLNETSNFYLLKHRLLPGFALKDRSEYLEQVQQGNAELESLDAWLDFAALKQGARPECKQITQYLNNSNDSLADEWAQHLSQPYSGSVSESILQCFAGLEDSKQNKKLLKEWQHYLKPDAKTPATWEYLPKPNPGYLVPIMVGYKAITPVYDNDEVDSTRDSDTPVCFVEAAHSIGEWWGVNRFRKPSDITDCLWQYSPREHWYLCRQEKSTIDDDSEADYQDSLSLEDELV